MQYLQLEKDQFTGLEIPQWKRSPLPSTTFTMAVNPFTATVVGQAPHVDLMAIMQTKPLSTGDLDWESIATYLTIDRHHQELLGPKFSSYMNSHFNQGLLIHAKGHQAQSLHVTYDLHANQALLIDHNLIVAEAGSNLDLVLDYRSNDEGVYQAYSNLKVVAKQGSRVKITRIQRLNVKSHSFQQVATEVAEGGQVIINDIQVGGHFKASSVVQRTRGRHADAKTHALYYGQAQSTTDVSYTMKHKGQKSTSTILTKGALQAHSKKVFRGNLFFEQGATGAVGKEEEFVMLLAEAVRADSIPGLFCKEDDVIGEHAASVGQIDANKLFYLMSRGFSETEARRLMVKSAYEEVLVAMNLGDLGAQISEEIDKRLHHGYAG